MKKLRVILLGMLVLAVVTATGSAKYPKSNILHSAHDLTYGSWSSGAPTESSVCFFCHIMHKTGASPLSTVVGPYLWNHTLSTYGPYNTYSSDSFNALLSAAGESISDLGSATVSSFNVSNLCLSCHDGTIALASFYVSASVTGLPGSGATFTPTTGSLAGTPVANLAGTGVQIEDLSKSHPVNFPYTANLATKYGPGLVSPNSLASVDSAGEIPLYALNAATTGATPGGYLECPTCHDPHNGTSNPSGFPFSRNFGSFTGSFCSACHM